MKRYAILFAVVLGTMLPIGVAASHAWGTGNNLEEFHYVHTNDVWKEDVCANPGGYAVMFYENTGYSGAQTRVCLGTTSDDGVRGDACDIPMGNETVSDYDAGTCRYSGAPLGTAKDKISSIDVLGGVPSGRCIKTFADANWSGDMRQFDLGRRSFEGFMDYWNDRIRSWKIDDCKPGAPVY